MWIMCWRHERRNLLEGGEKSPAASFSPRKHPQRSPEATPPVLSSAAALLDGLFEHPVRFVLLVLDVRTIEFPSCHNRYSTDFLCGCAAYGCLLPQSRALHHSPPLNCNH